MSGTVALTGATGFIGGALLRTLVDSGFHVRALTRRPQPAVANVTWVPGDLQTPAALSTLLAGANSLVHCAGAVRGKSVDEFKRVNVEGTQAIVSACLAQTARPRLLFMSTLAARAPELSWYATSKAAAENVIREQGQDLHWTILRPTAVYGPGDREMRPLFQWLLRGILPTPQPAGSRFSLLHVDDLSAAVLQWLGHRIETNRIFELCDGTDGGYDAATLARMVESQYGRRVRVLKLPATLLHLVARVNLVVSRATGRSPMLTPGKVRELIHPDWSADTVEFARATGWSPRVRFQDALLGRRLFFT
jgi:nucleoside-diphosphate-sugar epimerase